MRSFPGAARQRVAATAVALVSLAALTLPLAVPLAHADEDDLKNRKRDVQGQIDDAADDLHEASRQASRANAALVSARERLTAARADLAAARARLAEARERDAELQSELDAAEAALVAADAAYATGVAEVEEQRGVVRDNVIGIYTDGDPRLQALSSLLDSTSLSDINDRRLADQVITGAQTYAFDRLEEVEAQLADEAAAVERTKLAVETKREEAADHLAAMRTLVEETDAAKVAVQGYLDEARTARQQALAARSRDRATLQALKQREARIQEQLEALARRQAGRTGYTGDAGNFLASPVSGGYVTSPFGYRTHPIYGYYSLHNGTDFGASGGCGTPLVASAAGRVIDTYYDSVYGNRLFLSVGNVNGKNLVLIYNHMTSYKASEGDRVGRGEVVGTMGTTGWSTGCHLHFTVMADGTAVDPMPYL